MDKNYVLITGAYGGLGKAMAHKFAEAGYGLILLGRDNEKLASLEKRIGEKTEVLSISCDVSNWESCIKAHGLVKASNIHIKVLINNAGITYIQHFNDNYEIDRFVNLMNTNLNGAVYMTKLFMDDLIENKGSIINISSVIGYAPVIGRTAYAASKFGMEGFFSVLAAEMGNKLHIMMVYPTFIATHIREKTNGKHEVNEILTAESVAHQIFTAYKSMKKRIYIGRTAKLSKLMYKYLPNMYVNLMRKKVNKKED